MEELRIPGWTDKLARHVLAVRELAELLEGQPGYGDLRVLQVLRAMPDRVVFVVRHRGRKAVLKRFIGPNASAIVVSLKAELDHLAGHMSKGPLRAVACLHADPPNGIAIVSFAPGRRIGEMIAKADTERRLRLFRQAGEWLAAYTLGRRRLSAFGSGYWMDAILGRGRPALDGDDRLLLDRLEAALAARAAAHAGRPLTRGAIHGDFVPRNLHFHNGVIHGLDIQGECWLPVARDLALFMVSASLRKPSGDVSAFGLGAADLDAFLSSGVILANERDTVVAFFIGERLHRTLTEFAPSGRDKRPLRAMIEGYIASPIAP